jgi:hypothetical protein
MSLKPMLDPWLLSLESLLLEDDEELSSEEEALEGELAALCRSLIALDPTLSGLARAISSESMELGGSLPCVTRIPLSSGVEDISRDLVPYEATTRL